MGSPLCSNCAGFLRADWGAAAGRATEEIAGNDVKDGVGRMQIAAEQFVKCLTRDRDHGRRSAGHFDRGRARTPVMTPSSPKTEPALARPKPCDRCRRAPRPRSCLVPARTSVSEVRRRGKSGRPRRKHGDRLPGDIGKRVEIQPGKHLDGQESAMTTMASERTAARKPAARHRPSWTAPRCATGAPQPALQFPVDRAGKRGNRECGDQRVAIAGQAP